MITWLKKMIKGKNDNRVEKIITGAEKIIIGWKIIKGWKE